MGGSVSSVGLRTVTANVMVTKRVTKRVKVTITIRVKVEVAFLGDLPWE